MFSLVMEKENFDSNGRGGKLLYKNDKICSVQTWGLSSCAVAMLQNFSYGARFTEDMLNEMFNFLNENLDDDWKPQEYYFMLSTRQIRNHTFDPLIKHKNVKFRDAFKNKSHGPNNVYLYRYSKDNDFKRRKPKCV